MFRLRFRYAAVALTIVVLVGALALAACGDDDSDDSGSVASPTATEKPTTTATPSETATASASPSETATASATPSETATMTATPTEAAGAPHEVSVVMTDIAYNVDEIDAVAGEPLTIHFDNQGAVDHDFVIDDISVSDVSAAGGMNTSGEDASIHMHLQPDEQATLTFTPDEPGSYTFYCNEPGHREAGMEGTLVVS